MKPLAVFLIFGLFYSKFIPGLLDNVVYESFLEI